MLPVRARERLVLKFNIQMVMRICKHLANVEIYHVHCSLVQHALSALALKDV